MHPEVRRAGAIVEAVTVEQALTLGLARSAAGRSRSRRGAPATRPASRLRSRRARIRRSLPSRRRRCATAGLDEAVPKAHVADLLGRMAAQLRMVRQGLGGVVCDRRDRLDRMAVLPGVPRELLGFELPGRPPLVEGMAQDIPPFPASLDSIPDSFVDHGYPFRGLGQHQTGGASSLPTPDRRPSNEHGHRRAGDPGPDCAGTTPTATRSWRSSRPPGRCSSTSSTSPSSTACRALPYVIGWDERYRDAGLTTLGIHSPRFGFTKRGELLAPALERLGVTLSGCRRLRLRRLARLRL